ncbi:MAG: hypothetical protein ACMXYK_04025 [Candidatus Woesearchaeota archaeon]
MRRGAQVSIFIILGIVILLVASMIIFFQSDGTLQQIAPVPSPVFGFTSQCLNDVTREALVKAGMQGGYVELPDFYEIPSSHISQGGLRVPLWLFRGNFRIPTRQILEQQIALYVEENIDSCLQLEHVELTSQGVPVAEVSVNDFDVTVLLNYTIVENNNRFTENYRAVLDVNLGQILDAGEYMTLKHHNDPLLERNTMNIISMDEELPIGGIQFSCENLFWSRQEVMFHLQNQISQLTSQIRMENSRHKPFNEPLAVYERYDEEWDADRVAAEGLPDHLPEDMYSYLHLYWRSEFPFNSLNVGFSYFPEYGMRMEVNPSRGDRIQARASRSRSDLLRFFCVNIYHFTYDIEYPVRVSLYDDAAFGGDGYSFNFALPVTIQRNLPTRDQVNFLSFDAFLTDENFCGEVFEEDTFVVARDYVTGLPISNVEIRYDCIKYYCELGETNTFENYGAPQLRTNFPLGCSNGFIIAEHDDYVDITEQVLDITGQPAVEFRMLPLQTFRLIGAQLSGNPIRGDYKIGVYMRSDEFDFEVFASYPDAGISNTIQLLNMPLTYETEVFLTHRNNIVGGWIGNVTVTPEDLQKETLYFFPYERLPHPTTGEERVNLFMFLDINDTYREQYAPRFE